MTDTRSVADQILVDCPDMVLREVSIGSRPLYVLEGDRARCDIYPLGDLGWNINYYRKVGDYQPMEGASSMSSTWTRSSAISTGWPICPRPSDPLLHPRLVPG